VRLNPAKLSVEEIRRLLQQGAPISAHLLRKLQRDPRLGVRRLHETLRRKWESAKGERTRLDAMLNFERVLWRSGVRHVAGVDEVGMGPLAGPVVAAAVVFPAGTEIDGIDDSKRLDRSVREELAGTIRAKALAIGIGLAQVEEIERVNIYRAGLLAMRRAVDGLRPFPEHVLVDAREIPDLPVPQNTFNKGDGINFSIAAASIVAKTHRDQLMVELDREYPGYGFASHKGYCTRAHQQAIQRRGPCVAHRASFIRELCGELSATFYALKQRLDAAGDRAGLPAVEAELAAQRGRLTDNEYRKLRLILGRRWTAL
jgi:ribonuclease HII